MKRIARVLTFMPMLLISTHAFGDDGPIAREWKLPLHTHSRKEWRSVHISEKAGFMAKRFKHLHTGIDIVNPKGGPGEAVYAAAAGKVVSIYAKEPNLGVMIQHRLPYDEIVWSVYVHVTHINARIGDVVSSNTAIAHVMNKDQLKKHGWEYKHLHFEILKKPRVNEVGKYVSYSTRCKTRQEVEKHFYDPKAFLQRMFASDRSGNLLKGF
jgi:murein DD-endopeptidase MepM/ murein hydrolase activator NlpD